MKQKKKKLSKKLELRKAIIMKKDTYKNLLIGSYKRYVVYVKKSSRKSSKKYTFFYKNVIIFIKISTFNKTITEYEKFIKNVLAYIKFLDFYE